MTWPLRQSPRDLIGQAVAALVTNRFRALLSTIGIVMGVATIVTAQAIGEGARRAALAEISAMGIDNIFVRSTARPGAPPDRTPLSAPALSLRDVQLIQDSVEHALAVAAVRSAWTDIAAEHGRAAAWMSGVTPSTRELFDLTIASGRWFAAEDERASKRVAVIGGALTQRLFADADPVGAVVSAGGSWYTIVGRLDTTVAGHGRAWQQVHLDEALLVPLSTMDVRLGKGDSIDLVQEIGVRVAGPREVERAAQAVLALMNRRGSTDAQVEVVVPRELLRARLRAQRSFNAVVVGTGLLALLISGVGIMNIMLASVTERTPEIGVRRAFGARRDEIVAQFACESALLCVTGGFAGLPLGAAFTGLVALVAGWPVNFTIGSALLALMLAGMTGLAFGIYPAWVAARVQPIDALRAGC
jgi:putative ABC transport system permease protein